MYFEPTRKTYYRFPSHSSAQNFDERHYYPDKPYASGEDSRYTSQVNEQKNYSDIKSEF
ncbi:MAG: hypothetical protein K0R46_1206 [Herbinix sp.]|jgi:hypothetical protein|nr:hypothetical protein [Herbinix sp.]